jgi:hypothetical protein
MVLSFDHSTTFSKAAMVKAHNKRLLLATDSLDVTFCHQFPQNSCFCDNWSQSFLQDMSPISSVRLKAFDWTSLSAFSVLSS